MRPKLVMLVLSMLLFSPEKFLAQEGSPAESDLLARSIESLSPLGPAMIATTSSFYGPTLTREQVLALGDMSAGVLGYPPAVEPAVVDMLAMMGNRGQYAAAQSTILAGRVAAFNSSFTVTEPTGSELLRLGVVTPLMLDLEGSGVADIAGSNPAPHPYSFDTSRTAFLDMDGDGYVDYTEWVGPRAGLLLSPTSPNKVKEKDGRLVWDGPFSSADLVGTIGGYKNGFEHLSIFDRNDDGRISGEELSSIYVWMDSNGNAMPDAGELHRPADLGIDRLNLSHSGVEGSFERRGGVFKMWDWWPTVVAIRPRVEKQGEGKRDVHLRGTVEPLGGPGLSANIVPERLGGRHFIPLDSLEQHGFNSPEGLLARLDPLGKTMVLVDYAPAVPHNGRIWVLRRTNEGWRLLRFSVESHPIDQVVFDESGDRLLVLAQHQSQLYIIDGYTSGKGGRLSRIEWKKNGFRTVAWGTPMARGHEYYLPGYFHDSAKQPLQDALARLSVNPAGARLSPAADIRWLNGDLLTERGLDKPFILWIESPRLSYAAGLASTGEAVLVALLGSDESRGEVLEIDKAHAIGGISANGNRVEYFVQREDGRWEVRWAKLSDHPGNRGEPPLSVPVDYRPSCPELADHGHILMWVEIDWSGRHARFWTLDALKPGSSPKLVTEIPSMIGPLRVAKRAPIYALQTPSGFIVDAIE